MQIGPETISSFIYAYSNELACTTLAENCPGQELELINQALLAPPPLYSRKFSRKTATYLLSLIAQLYFSVLQKKPLLLPKQLELVQSFSFSEDLHDPNPLIALLYHDKKENLAYLIFRGTIGDQEFALDLRYSQVLFEGFKVHEGFSRAYADLAPSINEALAKLQPRRIYVAGHSLGAALAVLASFDLAKSFPYLQTYSFASPRVASPGFAQEMKKRVQRNFNVQNICDIVPQVPLSVMPCLLNPSLLYFYNHVGEIYAFQENWLSYVGNHSLAVYIKNMKDSSKAVSL